MMFNDCMFSLKYIVFLKYISFQTETGSRCYKHHYTTHRKCSRTTGWIPQKQSFWFTYLCDTWSFPVRSRTRESSRLLSVGSPMCMATLIQLQALNQFGPACFQKLREIDQTWQTSVSVLLMNECSYVNLLNKTTPAVCIT